MANRDVQLIIRAKNQASKVLDGVSNSLKAFTESQERLAGSANDTDQALGALASQFGKLNNQIEGAKAIDRMSGSLSKAEIGLTNLKGTVAQSENDLESYTSEAAQAADRLAELRAEATRLGEALSKQKADMAAAKQNIVTVAAATRELARAEDAYQKAVARETEGKAVDLGKAKARIDAAKATKQAAEETAAALAAQRAAQDATEKSIVSNNAAIREANKAHKSLQVAVESETAALAENRAALEQGQQVYGELKTRVAQAAQSFGLMVDEQGKFAAVTPKVAAEAQRLVDVMAALSRYSTRGPAGFVNAGSAEQFRKVRSEIEENQKAWDDLQGEIARVAKEMKSVGKPTAEMTEEFGRLTRAARAAKDTNERLQVALHKLQGTAGELTVMSAVADDLRKSGEAAQNQAARFEKLNQAIDRYRTGGESLAGSELADKLRRQNVVVSEAAQRVETLRAALTRLQGQMRGGDGSAATAARYREVAGALNLAEKEAKEAAAAMARLQTVERGGLFSGSINSSRTALGAFQRLRGEVLSLVTAYVGLYGAISNVQGVLSAYQKMEAAQNRLGVIFGSDNAAIRNEMSWLQAQAARLGIEFGSLSDQYTKFAVAARAANFSAKDTRDVFMAVAEAGRVNKLSLDDMNGVFLALQQMISKGRIGSEELRQQLGERLPGAMNIMADALGMTTGELSKMMEEGQVLADSSNMLKFASQLNKVFGAQLPKALQSTTTQIGKFWDNVFQAQTQVASGGFIESFNRLLGEMNKWFQSREGRDFFLSLGAAMGKVADGLTYVVKNFDSLKVVLIAVAAIKMGQWITGIVGNLVALSAEAAKGSKSLIMLGEAKKRVQASGAAMATAIQTQVTGLRTFDQQLAASYRGQSLFQRAALMSSTAMVTLSSRMGVARIGAGLMSAGITAATFAVRGLSAVVSALGGPLGILIQIGTFFAANAIAQWAGGVDDATQAMDEHQRITQAVIAQYDELNGQASGWADTVKSVTLDQANANLRNMITEFEKLRAAATDIDITTVSVGGFAGGFDTEIRAAVPVLRDLSQAYRDNELSAKDYRVELEKIYASTKSPALQKYLEGMLDTARAAEEQADKVAIAAETAAGFGSTLEIIAEALGLSETRLKDVTEATDDTTDALETGAAAAATYGDAINKMKEFIPELREEMERLKKTTELNAAAWTALISAWQSGDWSKILEVTKLWGQGLLAINAPNGGKGMNAGNYESVYTAGRGTPEGDRMAELVAATTALAEKMGVSAKDLLTVMSYETGGKFDPALYGGAGGKYLGLIQFSPDNQERYGVNPNNSITDQVVAAGQYLEDAGVKAGDGLLQIYAAINAGSPTKIYASDANNGGMPGTVLDKVSGQMEGHKARADGLIAAYGSVVVEAKEIYDTEVKTTEEKKKQQEATDQALADMGFENEMLTARLAGKEKEAFIEEELRRLKEQNPNITADEIAKARELLTVKWQQNQALDAQKEKGTEIEQQQQRIADLETQRNALLEQRKIYEEQGNTEKLKETDAALVGINSQLTAAIQQAIAMQQALGGAGADASIAKLTTMGLAIENANLAGQKMKYTATQMQESIAGALSSGIVNMVDAFAQAVANGEDAVGALSDAFRQFAADFLLMIAKMILEQIAFNAVQAIAKALTGGLSGIMGFHTGGVVGAAGNPLIQASPSWFANAVRYHQGGIAGLKPGEMPAVLKVGEEVLTENDPRHIRNGGGKSSGGGSTKVVNMFDAASFLSESLSAVIGEEAILNYVRANPGAFKQAMGA